MHASSDIPPRLQANQREAGPACARQHPPTHPFLTGMSPSSRLHQLGRAHTPWAGSAQTRTRAASTVCVPAPCPALVHRLTAARGPTHHQRLPVLPRSVAGVGAAGHPVKQPRQHLVATAAAEVVVVPQLAGPGHADHRLAGPQVLSQAQPGQASETEMQTTVGMELKVAALACTLYYGVLAKQPTPYARLHVLSWHDEHGVPHPGRYPCTSTTCEGAGSRLPVIGLLVEVRCQAQRPPLPHCHTAYAHNAGTLDRRAAATHARTHRPTLDARSSRRPGATCRVAPSTTPPLDTSHASSDC